MILGAVANARVRRPRDGVRASGAVSGSGALHLVNIEMGFTVRISGSHDDLPATFVSELGAAIEAAIQGVGRGLYLFGSDGAACWTRHCINRFAMVIVHRYRALTGRHRFG